MNRNRLFTFRKQMGSVVLETQSKCLRTEAESSAVSQNVHWCSYSYCFEDLSIHTGNFVCVMTELYPDRPRWYTESGEKNGGH